jgi:hypothetical protein
MEQVSIGPKGGISDPYGVGEVRIRAVDRVVRCACDELEVSRNVPGERTQGLDGDGIQASLGSMLHDQLLVQKCWCLYRYDVLPVSDVFRNGCIASFAKSISDAT